MNLEIRVENDCPKDWNRNLQCTQMGNIFNTFEYSQYPKKRLKWRPSFVSVLTGNGNIIGQAVLFEYTRNKINNKIPSKLQKFALKITNTVKWIYGPVCDDQEQQEVMNQFLSFVYQKGKRIDGTTHPFFSGEINVTGIKKEKWTTFIIDLKQPKDLIWEKLDKKSARKNVERSEERGVQIKEINNKNLPEYHELLNSFRIASGNPPYEYDDTFVLWDLLKEVGFKGFLASKDGVNMGGITFSYFNGYVNEWGIARSSLDTSEKLYSQDLLKWKIMEWGIQNNQKFYDLSGANPNPINEKEEGILKYKKKWGGKQYDYWLVKK